MSVSIQFLGAAGTVTGSSYLVRSDNATFLVDCGMFQGPDVEDRNFEPFEFDPTELDFVLLTHAHLDHIGLMPKLTRAGYRGPIYATYHTVQIGEIIVLDSAKIQENNYAKGIPATSSGRIELLYDNMNSQQVIDQFEIVNWDEEFNPVDGVEVKFMKAAHILGAACIEVEIEGKKIAFSGDIGRKNHDLIDDFDPDYRAEVDYVVMESLYGGQHHPPRPESVGQLMDIVRRTVERGGSVYIPCFAVQRTQEIVNDFKRAKESGALPEDLQVWLDSPMAQRVTEIYTAALDHAKDSLFNFDGMRYVKYYRQSMKLSNRRGVVVIAGSGMANGGRILSHLANNLHNKKNSVIFVGFQAENTIGRELSEGAKTITIDETDFKVKAEIHHLHGFSAHADDSDLMRWLNRYTSPRLKRTFLVHAEPERSETFQDEMNFKEIDHPYIPAWKEVVEL